MVPRANVELMSGRFSLVLLDLDGVLVDSAAAMTRAVDAALAEIGVVSAPPEKQRLLFGPPLYVGFASLLEAMGADPSVQRAMRRSLPPELP